MPTQITTAVHQDSLSGSPEKRIDVDRDGRLWLAVADAGKIRFFSSTDGTSWSVSGTSDLAFGAGATTGVPSFWIDADGYAHVAVVRWQASPQTILYARGTPRSGGGWSWRTLTISPSGGRTGVDTDVIAFRHGTGWVAWVCWDINSSGGTRVSRIDISASGSLSLGATVHGPSGGDATYQMGSLTFHHTGDGKTPTATPHLYLVTASQATSSPVYAHRAQYNSGTWTWESPTQLASGVTVPDTVLCSVHDGTRLIVAWCTGDATVKASTWTGTGGATAVDPASPALGTVKGISMAVDPDTDDVYLVAYGATDGNVYLAVLTGASWSSWTQVATRSVNTQDGDVQLVRHPPRDGVDLAYAIGNSPNITIWHTRIADLVRAPGAPTLLEPAPGARLDLASGATFRWDHTETGPGDSQSAWQLRRTYAAVTEYWNAATLSWGGAGGYSESFASQNTVDWTGWGANVAVSAGRLQVTPTNAYPSLYRSTSQSLVDSSIAVEITQLPNVGNGTTGMFLFFNLDASNRVEISWANGTLYMREKVAGVDDETTITYNATDHRWWRIRESLGTVYWETSPNGVDWTVRKSKTGVLDLSAGQPYLSAGFYGTEPTPGIALFDNFSQGGGGGSTPVWNPSAAVNPEQAVFPAGYWTTGTTYSWSVRTKSAAGEESAWALDRTVIASVAPVVVITAPTGIVFGTTTPEVTWTYTSARPQRDFEVRITDPAVAADETGPVLWTSGQVPSSAARSVRVGDALPDPSGTYRAHLRVYDLDGVASSWVTATFSLSNLPPVGPSLGAVSVVPYWTGVPRVRLTTIGRSNYLSETQAAAGADWSAVANCTVAPVVEDLLNQTWGGFTLTSVAAGDMSAITDEGDPPEVPLGQEVLTGPLDFPVIADVAYTGLASFKVDAAVGAIRAVRVLIDWYATDDGAPAGAGASAGGTPGEVILGSAVPGGGETTWTGGSTHIATTAGLQVNADDTGYVQASVTAVAPTGAKLARLVVEVLSCVAGGEDVHVARPSFTPGRSLQWRPGGGADRQTVRIERSDDGEVTWTQIATGVATDYWQRTVLDDRTAPMGVDVHYRGYVDVASDTGGATQASDASSVSVVALAGRAWAVRDPGDDTAETLALVDDYSGSDDNGATVTWVAGNPYPIVDTETVRSGTRTLGLYVRRADYEATLDVLRRTGVLLVQSPRGEVLWGHVPSRDYRPEAAIDRRITVELVLAPPEPAATVL